jgi:hypothetical protein
MSSTGGYRKGAVEATTGLLSREVVEGPHEVAIEGGHRGPARGGYPRGVVGASAKRLSRESAEVLIPQNSIQLAANAVVDGHDVVWVGRFWRCCRGPRLCIFHTDTAAARLLPPTARPALAVRPEGCPVELGDDASVPTPPGQIRALCAPDAGPPPCPRMPAAPQQLPAKHAPHHGRRLLGARQRGAAQG